MHRMQSGGWPYSEVGRDSSETPSLRVACSFVHELEPAHGDQTACEGLVDKTNYLKTDWDCLNFYTLTRFKV